MAMDPGSDTHGDRGGQSANPAPDDIFGTLGMRQVEERGWAIVWSPTPPDWATVRHPDMPEELLLRVRVAHTEDGVAVVAALVERADGRAIGARDLRRVKLPPAWALASRPRSPELRRIALPRPGPRGKGDDHWRAVFDLWVRAKKVAPHTPVRWMRTQWSGDVSDATMRRWVKRARERAVINKWEEKID
ncbi:MAG: hypothetical protein ACLPKI_23050 [Streptosporangiaceae bacterium]